MKGAPFAGLAVHGNGPLVRFDDFLCRRQTQTASPRARGIVGVENVGQFVGRNALTGIADLNDRVVLLPVRPNHQLTFARHGLLGIDKQIQHDLF